MAQITLAEGDILFRENESADYMYHVADGEIEVFTTVNGERNVLATFPKGDVFGELGLILGERRTATAVATQPTRLTAISQKELFVRIQRDPLFAARLVKRLAVKLHGANQVIKEQISERRSLEITYGQVLGRTMNEVDAKRE